MSAPDQFAFAVSASAVAAIGRHRASAKPKRGKRVAFTVYEGEGSHHRPDWARCLGLVITHPGRRRWLHASGPPWAAMVRVRVQAEARLWPQRRDHHGMHGGEFAGKPARYVLRSRVVFADPADAARHGGDQ